MSLDVYLKVENPITKRGTGVFVRDSGGNRELTVEEVKAKWPDSNVEEMEVDTDTVFDWNITHNLGGMADAAGLYEALWRPYRLRESYDIPEGNYDAEHEFEADQVILAKELIEPLREGLHRLKSDPEKYRKLNPKNGWGCYEGLVEFTSKYLDACYEYPDAVVETSR
jgi:hypothetical protein